MRLCPAVLPPILSACVIYHSETGRTRAVAERLADLVRRAAS